MIKYFIAFVIIIYISPVYSFEYTPSCDDDVYIEYKKTSFLKDFNVQYAAAFEDKRGDKFIFLDKDFFENDSYSPHLKIHVVEHECAHIKKHFTKNTKIGYNNKAILNDNIEKEADCEAVKSMKSRFNISDKSIHKMLNEFTKVTTLSDSSVLIAKSLSRKLNMKRCLSKLSLLD